MHGGFQLIYFWRKTCIKYLACWSGAIHIHCVRILGAQISNIDFIPGFYHYVLVKFNSEEKHASVICTLDVLV